MNQAEVEKRAKMACREWRDNRGGRVFAEMGRCVAESKGSSMQKRTFTERAVSWTSEWMPRKSMIIEWSMTHRMEVWSEPCTFMAFRVGVFSMQMRVGRYLQCFSVWCASECAWIDDRFAWIFYCILGTGTASLRCGCVDGVAIHRIVWIVYHKIPTNRQMDALLREIGSKEREFQLRQL